MRNDATGIGIMLLAVFLSIALHEFGHAKVADMAGDPTPRAQGRVTLNPFAHFDPLGAIMIVASTLSGFGIGWGKPVQVNPLRMRNMRWDHFWSVAAGPLTNLVLAFVFAIVGRLVFGSPNLVGASFDENANVFARFCDSMIFCNLGLMLFNLIPLGPLDGHWLVGAFLPFETRLKWYAFNRTMGSFLLLGIIILGQTSNFSILGNIIGPPLLFIYKFLLGA